MSRSYGTTNSLFRLDAKVAVVSGGSRGLGLFAAEAILRGGAKKVILISRKAEGSQGLDAAVTYLTSLDGVCGSVMAIPADILNTREIERVVARVGQEEDVVDILIANAGTTWGGPFEPTPDSSSQKVLDLNVRSVFNLIRLMVPLLAKAGTEDDPSRVVIMGSVAGISVPHVGEHGTIMLMNCHLARPQYSASKAAAHHLARNLAVELGPRRITTNAVAPGYFPSKLANGIIKLLGGEEELGRARNPRRRLGKPKDIEGAIIYLCSPAGAYVNGAVIPLDGGAHLTAGINTKL